MSFLIVALLIFLGAMTQTMVGFGLAIVVVPFLVFIDPSMVPILITELALVLSLLNAWKHRHDVQLKSIAIPMVTRVPGTALGVYLLLIISLAWLKILIGVMVLMAVLVTVSSYKVKTNVWTLSLAGFFSGVFGSSTSVGGPPMAIVYQNEKPDVIRANLSFYFTYACVVALIAYALAGILTMDLFLKALYLLPIVYLAFKAGMYFKHVMSEKKMRIALLSLCSFSAIIALTSGLIELWGAF